MKKRFASTFVLLIMMILVACGPTATPEPAAQIEPTSPPPEPTAASVDEAPTEKPTETVEEAQPVVLRVGGIQDIDCWNPFTCARVWDWGDLVYEGLAGHGAGPGCPAVPRLAESWEVSDDGLTWTFHLHEGITYSDGEPLNAHTLVDFFKWWNSTELKWWYPETSEMTSVEALDDYTLQYTTSVPILNSPFGDLVWLWFVPPHIWGDFDDAELLAYEAYPPVGTGPYVVSDWQPGEYMIFDAREDYYRGELPVDRIIYQIYGNTDAMVSAYLGGEVDLLHYATPVQYFDALSEAESTAIEETPPGDVYYLAFNMFNLDDRANKHPAVEDLVVREAIDYAIDREQLVEVALLGHGVPCPTNWACGPRYEAELNPDLQVTTFDLDKANDLLDDAGYIDSDGDGIRETSNGLALEFRLFYEEERATVLIIADMIKAWLAEIGIRVSVQAVESGTMYGMVYGDRDFDMALLFWGPDLEATPSMSFQYSCWAAEVGIEGGLNDSGYCNEDFDDKLYGSWYAATEEEADALMWEAQAIINQDRPNLTLVGQNLIQYYRNDKFGFPEYTCDVGLGMWNFPSVLEIEVKK